MQVVNMQLKVVILKVNIIGSIIKVREDKSMRTTICSAIDSKQVIQFDYDGGSRVVEPFCYGISTAGNEMLRGYQTSGYSKSGKEVGWKPFLASKISRLVVTDEHFTGIRDGYNPNDEAMRTIYCHV